MSETVSTTAAARVEFAESPRRFRVVCNEEEQYSIWPESREIPAGWRDTGVAGEQQDCLDHIEKVWQDMRPLSLRRTEGAA
jgi:MbtH protein